MPTVRTAPTMSSTAGRRAVVTSLIGMAKPELERLVAELGAPKYRAKQIADGLYGVRRCRDIDAFHNIPASLRAGLVERGMNTGRLACVNSVLAADGTGKLLLSVGEREVIETIGIPDASCFDGGENGNRVGDFSGVRGWDRQRLTACVSSQVGCAQKCSFCATGLQGFKRNLTAAEIVSQVLELEHAYGKRCSHVVFMGMGEPLLNMKNVVRAIRCMNEDIGIGGRHITVSTVGIPNSLAKFAAEKLPITLAVSLHAPDQETREKIVPSARNYSIDDLLNDARDYFRVTGRRVTFEYTLLAGVNDSPHQAKLLGKTLKRKFGPGAHVNVIPWNPIEELSSKHSRPSGNALHRFCSILSEEGVNQSIRRTRGLETEAACGQLRGDFERRRLGVKPP